MAKSKTTGRATKSGLPLMKKITVKSVMEQAPKDIAKEYENKAVVGLFKIAGIVHRCSPISTQYGDSIRFIGKFVVEREDGKKWEGNQFFAPGDLEDELSGHWANRADGENTIEFAADVSLQVDAAIQIGYTYVSEPLVEAGTSAPMAALLKRAGMDVPKSLEGPK